LAKEIGSKIIINVQLLVNAWIEIFDANVNFSNMLEAGKPYLLFGSHIRMAGTH